MLWSKACCCCYQDMILREKVSRHNYTSQKQTNKWTNQPTKTKTVRTRTEAFQGHATVLIYVQQLSFIHTSRFQSAFPEGALRRLSWHFSTAVLTIYLQTANCPTTLANSEVSLWLLSSLLSFWTEISHFTAAFWKAMPATDANCHWSKSQKLFMSEFSNEHDKVRI